jgi:drug/metabolite transporter (DMT)-like permease
MKTSKSHGDVTVLLQLLSGISILILLPLFNISWSSDYRIYLFLGLACIFYAISDRLNTTVISGIEASTFSILSKISTVFMILAGLFFFKEPFVLNKIIGATLIILSNIFIFYKKGKTHFNKYVLLGVLANLTLTTAFFIDVNLSNDFNLPFYVAFTLIVPALFIFIFEKLKLSSIKNEYINGNKKAIIVTSVCWGLLILCSLRAYQLGEVTSVAPL